MYREFPEFSFATLRGLLRAIASDHNVFLIALAGVLLGGRKGLGGALLFFIGARRLDDALKVWVLQTERIARSIDDAG